MGRVTAALIVRDEARVIDDCLASLVGRVDEIVVVDTGSCDDTIERARRYPVQLHHFKWCDDFSAARNFAVEQATGDWILYIDADERLEAPRPEILSAALAATGNVAWTLRFHPRVDWTPYAELRLFRNDPRIRFRGAIHERIQDGIDEVARTDGKAIGACDIALQHVGYEEDQTYKNARNIPLLRGRLERDPGHLYSWWHLGQCHGLAGDEDAALAAWSHGMELARALPASSRLLSDAQSAVSFLILSIKRGADVTAELRNALALFPEHLSLQWIAATLALEHGDVEKSRPILESLAAIDADGFYDRRVSYDKAIFRHLAKEALGLCHFRAGRFKEAAGLYRLAAQHSPDRVACEAKARLAELRLARQ